MVKLNNFFNKEVHILYSTVLSIANSIGYSRQDKALVRHVFVTRWRPPIQGGEKINFDAAVKELALVDTWRRRKPTNHTYVAKVIKECRGLLFGEDDIRLEFVKRHNGCCVGSLSHNAMEMTCVRRGDFRLDMLAASRLFYMNSSTEGVFIISCFAAIFSGDEARGQQRTNRYYVYLSLSTLSLCMASFCMLVHIGVFGVSGLIFGKVRQSAKDLG
ncbi:hypothetical protein E2542_SST09507 [Spatholobus suberectus]|nr:hypothetical protein E2542_SST09507 [Spatholobus suberectus]